MLAFVLVVAYTYYFHQEKSVSALVSTAEFMATPSSKAEALAPSRVSPAGLKEYRNEAPLFSLFYPKNLMITQFKEPAGATTLTFEDATGEYGFQIYIVPYAGTHVTKEQFNLDVPSKVMNQPIDVMIDTVRATMFFSRDALLGDTREVWFIHNGFLYEVTAYKALDAWLADIMQTWKFFTV